MKCLSSLALVLLVALAVDVDAAVVFVDDATVQSEWNAFKSERGLKFSSAADESQKKSNFAYHYRQMAAARQTVLSSFELAPNDIFVESADAFDKMMGLVVPPSHKNQRSSMPAPLAPNHTLTTTERTRRRISNATLIAESPYPGIILNWADLGYVTPVKDQGACGSCWAFSATGALEGQMFKKHKGAVPVTSLSEQNLVDCTTNANGCAGGWMATAWAQIADEGGIEGSVTYPYTASQGTCRFNKANAVATDNGFGVALASGDEAAMLKALQTVGPISVAVDAIHTSFFAYSSGIYSEPQCSKTTVNHAVLIVGYGTYNGTDYWLIKNSWGTSWGIKGYMMMARNAGNMCAIANNPMYPVV